MGKHKPLGAHSIATVVGSLHYHDKELFLALSEALWKDLEVRVYDPSWTILSFGVENALKKRIRLENVPPNDPT